MEKERKALYVATHEFTTLTKIGVSKTISSRMNSIRTAVGCELTVYYESPLMDNWREIELEVIGKFKTNKTSGEWVNTTPKEIIKFIKTIEYKFNNPDYCFEENKIDKQQELIVQTFTPFYSSDVVGEPKIKKLYKVSKGVYRDENYNFIVCYHLGTTIRTVLFSVFKTANRFAKDLKIRLVELDLKNREFIKNPKFCIENE
jgi:hypothetical protein